MNNSKVIVLSLATIVVVGFAFNQLKQPEQAAQVFENLEPIAPINQSMPPSVQQNHQLYNNLIAIEQSNNTDMVAKPKSEVASKHMLSRSSVKALKQDQPSDHQGEYAQARPHGHEQHNSNFEQNAAIPPGEPKDTRVSPQPLN